MGNLWTQMKEQAVYLLKGPGSNTPSRSLIPIPQLEPSLNTSFIFESHMQEAGKGSRGLTTKNPQTISSAWDEREQYGNESSLVWQGLTAQDRKLIMLDLYLNIPAASTCVDVISKRIFSGGFTVEKVDEEAADNQQHYDTLMEFCLRVNEDWDFNQLGRSLVQDKLIFGECYAEIIPRGGVPYQLVKVDCIPMGYKSNKYGQIESFYQESVSTRKRTYLKPDNIIRWWFPHPRASIDPFAPIEKVTDPAVLDKKMFQWMISFFQKGGKFPYYFKGLGDQNEADRFITWAKQNILGEKNAHIPPATWGNAEIAPLGNQGALAMDFGKDQDRMEIKIYGAYGVPPAAASIIQTGAMGGHSEQEQDKMLIFNACDPTKEMFFEKLNYRVTKRGFNIHDYRITSRYAEYRSDKEIAETEDKRIRNGSRTINEIRTEGGKRPYKQGGDVAFVGTSKEITPVPRLDDIEDEQRQTAAVALQSAQANADLAQTKAKQAKEPPPESAMLPPGQNGNNLPQNGKNQAKSGKQNNGKQPEKLEQSDGKKPVIKQPGKRQKQETLFDVLDQAEESQGNTGAMVALMIPSDIGQQIALPGGEPVEDLHITLAYLGEAADIPAERLPLLQHALSDLAQNHYALSGRIAGLGRFDAPEGQPTPIIALPDIPGLSELRQALVYCLNDILVPANDEHGYTPHITLAYIDASAPMPIEDVAHLSLFFDTICLCLGDECTYFPLLGQKTQEDAPTISATPQTIWIAPDTDERLAALKADGVVAVKWIADGNPCEPCLLNHNTTVKLGETFMSGHQLAPAHPNCMCKNVFLYAQQEEQDDTQEMPAIRLKKPVRSLTELDLWEGRM